MLRKITALAVALLAAAILVPAISGAASFVPKRAGEMLTAPAKYKGHRVKRYAWERCNANGRSCKRIKGATHRTYRVGLRDVGHAFRVMLTVATSTGQLTVVSAATPVIALPDPVNLTLPTIGGTAEQGQILTSDPGTWTNAVSFTYQWEDCDATGANCVNIAGATASTYTLAASDVGHTIRLTVTAYNTAQVATAIRSTPFE